MDLIVHDSFYTYVYDKLKNHEVYDLVNLFSFSMFRKKFQKKCEDNVYIQDKNYESHYNVENNAYLNPYYKLNNNEDVVCTKQNKDTCYSFSEPIQLYTIDRRNYRVIIWRTDTPLPLCCTRLYVTDLINLSFIINNAINFIFNLILKYPVKCQVDVIVFDLDLTLIHDTIDEQDVLKDNVLNVLKYAKESYHLLVL